MVLILNQVEKQKFQNFNGDNGLWGWIMNIMRIDWMIQNFYSLQPTRTPRESEISNLAPGTTTDHGHHQILTTPPTPHTIKFSRNWSNFRNTFKKSLQKILDKGSTNCRDFETRKFYLSMFIDVEVIRNLIYRCLSISRSIISINLDKISIILSRSIFIDQTID